MIVQEQRLVLHVDALDFLELLIVVILNLLLFVIVIVISYLQLSQTRTVLLVSGYHSQKRQTFLVIVHYEPLEVDIWQYALQNGNFEVIQLGGEVKFLFVAKQRVVDHFVAEEGGYGEGHQSPRLDETEYGQLGCSLNVGISHCDFDLQGREVDDGKDHPHEYYHAQFQLHAQFILYVTDLVVQNYEGHGLGPVGEEEHADVYYVHEALVLEVEPRCELAIVIPALLSLIHWDQHVSIRDKYSDYANYGTR